MLQDAVDRLDEEEDNDELVEWVQGVCLPNYGVIDGMVANFIDNLQDAKFTQQLLRILKKLNQHVPATVLPQLFSNMYFPGALVAYLERTELKDLSGDALILLVNIFDDDNVESASELFI